MKRLLLCGMVIATGCASQVQEAAHETPLPVVEKKSAPSQTTPQPTPRTDIATVPINQVDKPPRLVQGAPPSYSFEMIQNKVDGLVRALVLVGRTGAVKEVTIIEHLGFGTDEATRTALMRYQFEPAMKNGEPVAVWIEMSVNFRPVRR